MAQKMKFVQNLHGAAQFPPEALAEFGDVSDNDIAAWRTKLNERFGIGKGKLVPTEEPKVCVRG